MLSSFFNTTIMLGTILGTGITMLIFIATLITISNGKSINVRTYFQKYKLLYIALAWQIMILVFADLVISSDFLKIVLGEDSLKALVVYIGCVSHFGTISLLVQEGLKKIYKKGKYING